MAWKNETRFDAVEIRVKTIGGIFMSLKSFRDENFPQTWETFFRLLGFA